MSREFAMKCRAIFVLLFSALSFAAIPAHAQVSVNVATAYAADNFHAQNLQRFADDLGAATGGRLQVKIHAAGSLLRPEQIFAGVQDGKAEAGEVMMSSLSKDIPLFGIDALPFIVSGYDDALRMWEASRAGVEKALHDRGLQLLYAVPWPPQNLYSVSPINSIRDFKGLRMRSYNPAIERIAELIGARPVTIQVIDLAPAIKDGKLDLMLTSSWTGVETKAWTRMHYYYRVSAWIPKNVVFINKKIFDKLDGETQKQLLAAAKRAEDRGWRMSQQNTQDFEDQLAANKIVVSNGDPFIRGYLDRVGENLAREWLKQAGSEELKILLKYTTDRSMKQ